MKRHLWGGVRSKEATPFKVIAPIAKKAKFEAIGIKKLTTKNLNVKLKNSIITQTVEVMKQTEMLQSLIQTYSNKSGSSNYLLNPRQMIPQVDFNPENATDFDSEDKFAKPFSFIPPFKSDFSSGVPKMYPLITKDVCSAVLRKTICGQLRLAGFTDASDSTLETFTNALEEFILSFLEQIKDIQSSDPKKIDSVIEVCTLEKAYFAFYSISMTASHSYFKNSLIRRNRHEIAEFKTMLQEYNKLMAESQKMQKEDFFDQEYLNVIEMTNSNEDIETKQELGNSL